jgi:hypothetical protein
VLLLFKYLVGMTVAVFLLALVSVFWIRIGFNADPDPAFYPDSDQILEPQKVKFLHVN